MRFIFRVSTWILLVLVYCGQFNEVSLQRKGGGGGGGRQGGGGGRQGGGGGAWSESWNSSSSESATWKSTWGTQGGGGGGGGAAGGGGFAAGGQKSGGQGSAGGKKGGGKKGGGGGGSAAGGKKGGGGGKTKASSNETVADRIKRCLGDAVGGGWGGQYAITLNDANSDAIYNQKNNWVVIVYRPTCSHCIETRPEWTKMAEKIYTKICVGTIDADQNPNTVEKLRKITKLSTIIALPKKDKSAKIRYPYNAPHTADKLIPWALQNSSP